MIGFPLLNHHLGWGRICCKCTPAQRYNGSFIPVATIPACVAEIHIMHLWKADFGRSTASIQPIPRQSKSNNTNP